MRLYPKMILVIACTFFAVMVVLLFSFEYTIMDSFSSLEKKYVDQDILRAEHAIEQEIDRIQQIGTDWAEWDTTYDFLVTHDPAYISSNLALSTFEALKIRYFIIQDLNGSIIVGRGISDNAPELTGIPPDLGALINKSRTETKRTGLIGWNNTAWLIAQNPILTTHQEGPSRGTLTILNPLDQQMCADISDLLLQNVTARILTQEEEISQNLPVLHATVTRDSIQAARVLPDIFGFPFLLLKVEGVRDLYMSGLYTRDYLFFSLLLLVICFMGVAITLINLIVIAPLGELNTELEKVGKSGLLSGRIKTGRDDEIGDLSRSINLMLDQIEQAVEQRHATEQRLSRLIALAEEGICLMGPDNHIWFANPKMASFFGMTPGELAGKSILNLLEAEQTIRPEELFADQPVHREFHTRKKDGADLYISVVAAPYPLEGGQEGHLCVMNDITTFKDNEKALLLSNKKLSLLGSMTRHDIVNQLTTIRGMLGLVHRKTTDEIILNLVEAAEEAADRVNKHIEFSKEYQKAGMQAPIWQNLGTCWNLAYAMTKKKGLTFSYQGEQVEVYADQLLQKVFYNLIDNSLKHGKNVFYISIHTKMRDSNLVILYEDDGEGIADSMKERIFERGVGSGTGWGLFFAREVLGLTGITITEQGTFGIGARFEIVVPEGGYRKVEIPTENISVIP